MIPLSATEVLDAQQIFYASQDLVTNEVAGHYGSQPWNQLSVCFAQGFSMWERRNSSSLVPRSFLTTMTIAWETHADRIVQRLLL